MASLGDAGEETARVNNSLISLYNSKFSGRTSNYLCQLRFLGCKQKKQTPINLSRRGLLGGYGASQTRFKGIAEESDCRRDRVWGSSGTLFEVHASVGKNGP